MISLTLIGIRNALQQKVEMDRLRSLEALVAIVEMRKLSRFSQLLLDGVRL